MFTKKNRIDAVGILISRRSNRYGDLSYRDDEVGKKVFLTQIGHKKWVNAFRYHCHGEEDVNYRIIARVSRE